MLCHIPGRISKHLQGLLQIDNMDTVALPKNILLHFRVPPPCLVAKMNSSLQKFLHRYFDSQCISSLLKGRFGSPCGGQRPFLPAPCQPWIYPGRTGLVTNACCTGSADALPSVRTSCVPSCADRASGNHSFAARAAIPDSNGTKRAKGPCAPLRPGRPPLRPSPVPALRADRAFA